MQLKVEEQVKVGARSGWLSIKHAQHPPMGIGFDILVAHLPQQNLLVAFLQAYFADMVSAAIGLSLNAIRLLLIDAAHIADNMGQQVALGVSPGQLGLYGDAGQSVAVYANDRDLLVRQSQLEGHRIVGSAAATALLKALQFIVLQPHQCIQSLEKCRQTSGSLHHHRQRLAGLVAGQQAPFAVVDQTTGRRQRLETHAVAFRLGQELLVTDNLQIVVTVKQRRDRREHGHAGHQNTTAMYGNFPAGISHRIPVSHGASGPMVRMVGDDRPRPVQLFRQDHPYQGVGHGDPTQGPASVGTRHQIGLQAIGTTDQYRHGSALTLAISKLAGHGLGADQLASHVQRDHRFTGLQLFANGAGFLGTEFPGVVSLASGRGYIEPFNPEIPR